MENTVRDDKFKDQVSATIIDSINQNRITDELLQLNIQDEYFRNAVNEIDNIRIFIGSPENILGSELTKHGEIAEKVEVGVRRAQQALHGKEFTATFENVGRTAPEDYIIDGINVQSKFINGTNNNLKSVLTHMEKYENFGRDNSYYHIPKDHFDIAYKIRNGENVQGINSRTKEAILNGIKKIEHESGKEFTEVVKPGTSTYAEVQKGKVHETLDNHSNELKNKNKKVNDNIVENHKPSLSESLKATGIAAAVGATVSLTTTIYIKSKEGKKIYKGEYSSEDWKDLGIETAKGGTVGAVTGGFVYTLTNYAGLSAPLAGAVVSATKSVTSLYNDYNNGKIEIDEFYELGMIVCSESAIVGLSTVVGQGLIPIPVLGAVVGSLAGTLLANSLGSDNKVTTRMIRKDLDMYLDKLDESSKILVNEIINEFNKLGDLTEASFGLDNNRKLLNLSIDLAIEYGIDGSELLKTTEEIDDFMSV